MSRFSLPTPLWVALRYLRSTRRDAYITFLSATAASGIALGIAALILSLAALSGFQTALREEVLARTPPIEITLPPTADLSQAMAQVRTTPGVRSVRPLARGRGWLLAAGRARPVELVGFSGPLPEQFPDASDRRPGLYLSDRLAAAWDLEAGEVVEVVSSRPTLTPLGPQPRVRRLELAGTFRSGRAEQDERAALPFELATGLLSRSSQRLLVDCDSFEEALSVAARLTSRLAPGSTVRTWRDLNKALLFALRLEKSLMFVAVFLIVVVAAMALVSDLMLISASKQAEVGMLGAMGMPPALVRRVFLWLGGLLVALGGAVGLGLGVGGAWLLDRYRLLSLPEQVYFLDYVPFVVRVPDVVMILAATVLLTLGCSWLAATRAAALQPVEALRR